MRRTVGLNLADTDLQGIELALGQSFGNARHGDSHCWRAAKKDEEIAL
jgi:hypothetical protein